MHVCVVFEDVGVPLMMDEYWDEDTVFFVFEDDFRFEDKTPVAIEEADEAADDAAPGDRFAPRLVESTKGQHRIKGQWWEVPTKVQNPDKVMGPLLSADLMHYMIEAHRNQCGDIVWLSWNAGHAGKPAHREEAPCFGATLLGVTVAGARSMDAAMKSGDLPAGHFDFNLAK